MNPTIEIEDLTENSIRFRLKNTSLAYANSLRRIMISEIPTMAIEFVTIRENTTPLHDEYIAHRLGLIPLSSSSIENFNYRADCLCSESANCTICSVKFRLSVKNLNEAVRNVTTDDLKQELKNDMGMQGKIDHQTSVKPITYPIVINGERVVRPILIMKLGKNQQLDLDCIATKGIGKEHAKWSPVCVAAFKFEPKITLNEVKGMQLNIDSKRAFVNCCPTKVFELNDEKKSVEVKDASKCMFCYECIKFQKDMNIEDLIKVEDGDFIFDIESNGALKPDEIVNFSFDVLGKKLETLRSELAKIGVSMN